MLNRALDIHASAEKPRDREWIHILLHFLRAYVDDMGRDLLMNKEDSEAYVAHLVQALNDAARELDSGMRLRSPPFCAGIDTNNRADTPSPDHTALSVMIATHDAQLAETRDGSLLRVVVHNKLPCVCPMFLYMERI